MRAMTEAKIYRITDAKSAGYDVLDTTEEFLQTRHDVCTDDAERLELAAVIKGIYKRRRQKNWFRRTSVAADNLATVTVLPIKERE